MVAHLSHVLHNQESHESGLLTDALCVESLPKYAGAALTVAKLNKGCLFHEIKKRLEECFGQTIKVTQAAMDERMSGTI